MTRDEAAALARSHRSAIIRGELHSCQHPGGHDHCPCRERAWWEQAVAAVYSLERFVEAHDARPP